MPKTRFAPKMVTTGGSGPSRAASSAPKKMPPWPSASRPTPGDGFSRQTAKRISVSRPWLNPKTTKRVRMSSPEGIGPHHALERSAGEVLDGSQKARSLTRHRRRFYTRGMGVPLRKMPADWEPEATPTSSDPFRYGWRWRSVHLPGGEVLDEQVPLTADDLLDPQPGDQVGQSQLHWELLFLLARILDRYYEVRNDVALAVDLKMLWRIPGLKEPAPDLAVIPGVRQKIDPSRTSFDIVEEGVRP